MNRPDGLPTGDAPRIEADSSTHEPGERTDTSRSPDPAAATTFARFLAEQRDKSQLRFITCGSVDDGKSTLLGRLLYDAQLVLDDQLSAAASESRTYGTQGGDVDLALLVDGLQAEREQGITIDVAYRYFETPKRKFIAADTPGHEQYTRNMATGASTADLAILLVDARHGVITQTRRHSFIVSLLGIRHIVLAVNKMDLVDYDQATFNAIDEAYRAFAGELGVEDVRSIPISALEGENITRSGSAMPWYAGPTLLSLLETIDVAADTDVADVTTSSTLGITDMTADQQAFRLPVQWVNRPDPSFRGFSGRIAAGAIQLGTTIRSSLTGRSSTLTRIVGPSGDLEEAVAGQSITAVLADEMDVSRGDTLTADAARQDVADQFAAHLIWMSDEPMIPERTYVARFAVAEATAQVTDLTHAIDVNTLAHHAARTLELNEIGYCKFALDKPVAFDAYADNRVTGSFVLIDRFTNATVGAGVISHPLRRASNIRWHDMKIDKQVRAAANGQRPCVLWFTGLSGSGKSTVADRLEQKLHALGHRTYLLDGDNVRHGLNRDLGFTDEDRVENIRRVAEVARLMVDAGLIVITSFISPFRSERQLARDLMEAGEYIEVFVDTPLEICEARDPKGLYKKARAGELRNFTGIDSDYEAPQAADIVLKAGEQDPDALADVVVAYLRDHGGLG